MKLSLIFILGILFATSVHGLSLGVSPGRIDYNDVLPGGYAEKYLSISTNSDQQIITSIKVEGELAEWISTEPNSTLFVISQGNPQKIKIKITPSKDARNASYEGRITFTTESFGNLTSRAGGIVRTAVALGVAAKITNQQITLCSAGNIEKSDAEFSNPIIISGDIANLGNVRIRPEVKTVIYDQSKKNKLLQKNFLADEILPTSQGSFIFSLPNQLETGQYYAEISVPACNALNFGFIEIVEPGKLSDKGELLTIENPNWATLKQNVPIKVNFTNQGPNPITAKFKGNVMLESKLVSPLESDPVTILPGETAEFVLYFQPQETGRYTIVGRAVYNNKLSNERSSILNIMEEKAQQGAFLTKILPPIIYLAIIIAIIFMVRKIKRRKPIF